MLSNSGDAVTPHRPETRGEEIANAVTHGVGAGMSIAGLIALIVLTVLYGDGWQMVSVSIYGASSVFLFLASTLYHAVQSQPAKRVFHILDHVGIWLLIAGTYTPFLLVKMRTPLGWAFLVLIWTLALFGASFKAFFTSRFVTLSTLMYVAMGWLAIFLVKAMLDTLGMGGLAWVAAGGIAYTVGVFFFLWHRLRFSHAIWHLFVIAGSLCHFLVVVRYILLA